MKIGDLVTLSATGRKLKMWKWILPDDVGLIKKVSKSYFFIDWCKSSEDKQAWVPPRYVRTDIKYAKQKKAQTLGKG